MDQADSETTSSKHCFFACLGLFKRLIQLKYNETLLNFSKSLLICCSGVKAVISISNLRIKPNSLENEKKEYQTVIS